MNVLQVLSGTEVPYLSNQWRIHLRSEAWRRIPSTQLFSSITTCELVKPVNPLLALAVAATAIALLYALLSPLGPTHEQAGEVYASSLVKSNFTRVKVVGRGIAYGEPEEFTVRVGVQVLSLIHI